MQLAGLSALAVGRGETCEEDFDGDSAGPQRWVPTGPAGGSGLRFGLRERYVSAGIENGTLVGIEDGTLPVASRWARGTPAPGKGAEAGVLGRWIVMTGPRSGLARHCVPWQLSDEWPWRVPCNAASGSCCPGC